MLFRIVRGVPREVIGSCAANDTATWGDELDGGGCGWWGGRGAMCWLRTDNDNVLFVIGIGHDAESISL